MGKVVEGTCFIPIKVPLDGKFASRLEENQVWTPKMVIEQHIEEGYDLRMVIDLTNTDRYYDGIVQFEEKNIRYVKLPCDGFKHPPRRSEIRRFQKYVRDFRCQYPSSYIAVHCTHGLNRTGYLIANYLIKYQNCSVTSALERFTNARSPGLVKYSYVEALYREHGAPNEDIVYPDLPEWAQAKYSTC